MNKIKIKRDDLKSLYIQYDNNNVIQNPVDVNGKNLKFYTPVEIVSAGYNTDNELAFYDGDENEIFSVEVLANEVRVLTTAPSEDNDSGNFIFVVLDEEPLTKYNGYIYLIV